MVFTTNDIERTYEEEEAIYDKLIAECSGGECFEFDGDDYCEDCAGWDGESHRCECGNRRMSWEGNKFCKKDGTVDYYIIPTAY